MGTIKLTYEGFRIAILCALVEALDNADRPMIDLEHLARSKKIYFEPDWMIKVSAWLESEGLIEKSHAAKGSENTFVPSARGKEVVYDVLYDSPHADVMEKIFSPQPASSYRNKLISCRQFSDLLLISLCDRASDGLDEHGNKIDDVANYEYALRKIADEEGLKYDPSWFDHALSDFYHSDLVNHVGHDSDGNDLVLINAPAMRLAEELIKQYYDTKGFEVDSWRKPDSIEILSASSIIEARSHISKAMQVIAASQFTQEEKAQIRGLLQICENILDLPVPKIGLLRRLIEMMRGIKEISEIIQAILRAVQ